MPTFLLCLLLSSALASLPTPDAFVDHRLGELVQPKGPGCALAVDRAELPRLLRARGLADLERSTPITYETVFEAGSVSKQFTAAALAVLATQGRLSLEDDVRRYVPELPRQATPISLRMLLTHTSGLRNWDDLVELQGWPEGTRIYKPTYVLRLVARQRGLNFTPGTEYIYSNTNYVLAALVAERVARMNLTAFMRSTLFDRLDVKNTRWREDFAEVTPRRAQAYDKGRDGAWRLDMPFGDVFGPGGLLTTVPDLMRWNEVLTTPGQADAAWVRMMTVHGRLVDGTELRYALGLETDAIKGVPVISHAGATAGYRTYLARAPSKALSLALLCNAGNLNTEDVGPEVLAAFLTEPASRAGVTVLTKATRLPDPSLLGEYRNTETDGRVRVTLEAGGLSLDGGAPYVEGRPGVFQNADGTRRLTAVRSELKISRTGNSPVTLAKLSRSDLARPSTVAFIGRYHSGEVDADTIISRDPVGDLAWIDPEGAEWKMLWLYGDVFDVPDSHWTLAFTRDQSHRVNGLRATSTRTRRVFFSRWAGAVPR